MAQYKDIDVILQNLPDDLPYKASVKRVLIQAPTADVVPKREGEWEKRTFIIFGMEKVGFRCSECNTTWDTPAKFCPNCGARMKGGAENDI